MGNMAIAAVAGKTAMNILDNRRQAKENKRNLYHQYAQIANNRKNLLEQQLASRRAKLGSVGISSSASSLAAQNREVKNAYNDIQYETDQYKRKIKSIDRDYRSGLINSGFDIATDDKLIK